MIAERHLRQYAAQTGASRQIALQEIALTYVLAALYEQPCADQLAFKGGTALRKLLFGPEGRFSVDLDFLGAGISDDRVLEIAGVLDGFAENGLSLTMGDYRFTTSDPDHVGRPTPHGFSADYRFVCALGDGRFGLDISRRRAALLPLRSLPLKPESYHPHMEIALPVPLALALEESAAEKVSALMRRMEHGNAKDVYDLWLYLGRPVDDALLRRLIVLTLWLDRRDIGADPNEFISRIRPGSFRWEELAGLLPRRAIDAEDVCRLVRQRLGEQFSALSADEALLLTDARSHRHVAVFTRLSASIPIGSGA